MTIITAILTLGSLALLLGLVLAFANKQFYVYEDPKIDIVKDMLPLANCGACGYPGCRPFAEALVAQNTSPSKCTVSTKEGHQKIADYLNIDIGNQNKTVARLACGGESNVARNRANYTGVKTCAGTTVCIYC